MAATTTSTASWPCRNGWTTRSRSCAVTTDHLPRKIGVVIARGLAVVGHCAQRRSYAVAAVRQARSRISGWRWQLTAPPATALHAQSFAQWAGGMQTLRLLIGKWAGRARDHHALSLRLPGSAARRQQSVRALRCRGNSRRRSRTASRPHGRRSPRRQVESAAPEESAMSVAAARHAPQRLRRILFLLCLLAGGTGQFGCGSSRQADLRRSPGWRQERERLRRRRLRLLCRAWTGLKICRGARLPPAWFPAGAVRLQSRRHQSRDQRQEHLDVVDRRQRSILGLACQPQLWVRRSPEARRLQPAGPVGPFRGRGPDRRARTRACR